ncbi:MAG: bifunctional (p)ppGpp synthetase/guanosine-3',5'-bis(diphosphate) 3'-pyrophosphohydrolase [Eubacteriales bacterium]|nr:bifunctional (p)ppGpp synthetase/guanosine-3',5'-bis(diphosphate) 3'-pyrophosphohydrolase [Eubacteriales bacterium]
MVVNSSNLKREKIGLRAEFKDPSQAKARTFEKCDQQSLARQVVKIAEEYRRYSKDDDLKEIYQAYEYAREKHKGQKRANGQPYIIHPIAVAAILLEIEVDKDTLKAAFLHDVVEDCDVTLDDIAEHFGDATAKLVDGVTKLSKLAYSSKEELQAQNFRKMFLAMAKDIRVVLIKLADRLHNMRTMSFKEPHKQVEKSRETLDIYAPLAHRLGIYKIKWELEDLCLRFLESEAYYELVGAIAQKRSLRESFLENIVIQLTEAINSLGLRAEIEGRPKHFYSIYRKMKSQNKGIDEIYDLFATRIIVPSVADCYAVLGLVHELYKPMPGRFKDYIAMPKPNMYQSLHSTVIGPNGVPFEVQIRTFDMHRTAEYGIAAHWRYKEGKSDKPANAAIESKLTWLRQLLEWQKDMSGPDEFMESLRQGLIEDEVFVFTPRGEVKPLPMGANPIDFAYAIHSDVGHHMSGAKVNGRQVPLNYVLANGDIVEIITTEKMNGPSLDWLKIVKSSNAKSKIRAWHKKSQREDNIHRGKHDLEEEIKKQGFEPGKLLQKQFYEPIVKRYSFSSIEDIYAAIGYRGISVNRIYPALRDRYLISLSDEERSKLGYRLNPNGQIVKLAKGGIQVEDLKSGERKEHREPKRKSSSCGVDVVGLDNALVKLANCCSPVKGDPIIGFITRGSGVTVHRTSCSNIRRLLELANRSEKDAERAARLIDVYWSGDEDISFDVRISIICYDRPGLFAEVSNAIAEERVTIISGQLNSAKDVTASLDLTIKVNAHRQLDRIVGRIKTIDGVISVRRV